MRMKWEPAVQGIQREEQCIPFNTQCIVIDGGQVKNLEKVLNKFKQKFKQELKNNCRYWSPYIDNEAANRATGCVGGTPCN